MEKNKNNLLNLPQVIKYLFIILSFLVICVTAYYVFINRNNKVRHQTSHSKLKNNNINQNEKNISFKIDKPDFVGINIKHGPYYINAQEIKEYSGVSSFDMPEVKLMLNHSDWVNIKSKSATLVIDNNNLQLIGDVKGDFNQEYYFLGGKVEILKNDSVVKSNEYSNFYSDQYNLKSQKGFILNYDKKNAFFYGEISFNIKETNDKSITKIKSDTLEVIWANQTATFLGNVIIVKEGVKVQANKMIAKISNKTNKLEKIYTYGNVRIADGNNKATSEYGEYDINTSILTLKENVKLYKENNMLSGELLHYNFLTKSANLVGSDNAKNKRVRAIITPSQLKGE